MTVLVSTAALHRILLHASASPALEVCGLLWGGSDTVRATTACDNVAAMPAVEFEIDPSALLAAHRRARDMATMRLVGHYHSHPGGVAWPSRRDAIASHGDGALWLIVADRAARLWRARPGGDVLGSFDPVAIRLNGDYRIDKPAFGVRLRSEEQGGGLSLEYLA